MNVIKPWYLFRPGQVLRRIAYPLTARRPSLAITTCWGAAMRVRPTDSIGRALLTTGVWELAVSEVIWRLLGDHDTAVDVGANIGYMTLLMKSRARSGRVITFEPHPAIFEQLSGNLELNPDGNCEVAAHRLALSDREGHGSLYEPRGFASNAGTASLLPSSETERVLECSVTTLDRMLGASPVKLLKMDVEGHELTVLHGAVHALGSGRIEHIVFEDHQGIGSRVCDVLRANGYSIFRIDWKLRGLALTTDDQARPWESRNYLATLHPELASNACRPRGWRVLNPRRSERKANSPGMSFFEQPRKIDVAGSRP